MLEAAMVNWADLAEGISGTDVRHAPGAGAAGGAGFGAAALLGASLKPGASAFSTLLGLDDLIADADVVIVGEGSIDAQSLHGKAAISVARMAKAQGARVIAVCGRCNVDTEILRECGIDIVYAIEDHAPDKQSSMQMASVYLHECGRLIGRLLDD